MCGIAGVVFKGEGAEQRPLGATLLSMLNGCQHRGPDSTGLALYGPGGAALILRLFLDADLSRDPARWADRLAAVVARLGDLGGHVGRVDRREAFARVEVGFDGDVQRLSYTVEELTGVEIFSSGHALEIIKDEGTADHLAATHRADRFLGGHGVGHVRLATESEVNPSTAHPFWAYGFTDVSIVHNGQITNYFKMRRRLEQRGYRFRTENDSEVIAVYLADKMKSGSTMDEALERSLVELDGTFSFLVSTPEGIGYAKDAIGAKPMVVLETDEMVAVASEEVSLQRLTAATDKVYEPYPGTSHTWSRSTPATSAFAN